MRNLLLGTILGVSLTAALGLARNVGATSVGDTRALERIATALERMERRCNTAR